MKKIILSLFLGLALVFSAIGFAGCDLFNSNNSSGMQRADIMQVYAEAQANGFTGTYDEWVEWIKEQAKGEKGDKGDTGAKGDKGDDGRGILSVEKTSEGLTEDVYTITFTDNTSTTFTITKGENLQYYDTELITNKFLQLYSEFINKTVDIDSYRQTIIYTDYNEYGLNASTRTETRQYYADGETMKFYLSTPGSSFGSAEYVVMEDIDVVCRKVTEYDLDSKIYTVSYNRAYTTTSPLFLCWTGLDNLNIVNMQVLEEDCYQFNYVFISEDGLVKEIGNVIFKNSLVEEYNYISYYIYQYSEHSYFEFTNAMKLICEYNTGDFVVDVSNCRPKVDVNYYVGDLCVDNQTVQYSDEANYVYEPDYVRVRASLSEGQMILGWYLDEQFENEFDITNIPNELLNSLNDTNVINVYAKVVSAEDIFEYTKVGSYIQINGLTELGKTMSELEIPTQMTYDDNGDILTLDVKDIRFDYYETENLRTLTILANFDEIDFYGLNNATNLSSIEFVGNSNFTLIDGKFVCEEVNNEIVLRYILDPSADKTAPIVLSGEINKVAPTSNYNIFENYTGIIVPTSVTEIDASYTDEPFYFLENACPILNGSQTYTYYMWADWNHDLENPAYVK